MTDTVKVGDKTVYEDTAIFCKYCTEPISSPKDRQKYCDKDCKDAYWKNARIKGSMKSKGMHYAKLGGSLRLQRLLRYLSDGELYTTLEIIVGAKVCAVNVAVSELRRNGFDISCNLREITSDKSKVYEYQLHQWENV
jgi:hypothetical protein